MLRVSDICWTDDVQKDATIYYYSIYFFIPSFI
jgi:hypothetical protein